MKKVFLTVILLASIIIASAKEYNTSIWNRTLTTVSKAEELSGVHTLVDKDGSVYVTGTYDKDLSFAGNTLKNDGLTSAYMAKYDRNGNEKWLVGFNGTSLITAITTDADGNVYIAGTFFDDATFKGTNGSNVFSLESEDSYAAFFVSLDANGQVLAKRAIYSEANGDALSSGMYFPEEGDVYLRPTNLMVSGDKVYVSVNFTGDVPAFGWKGSYIDVFGFMYMDNKSAGVFSLDKSFEGETGIAVVQKKDNFSDQQFYPEALNFTVNNGSVYVGFFGFGNLTLTAGSLSSNFSFPISDDETGNKAHSFVLAIIGSSGMTAKTYDAAMHDKDAKPYNITSMDVNGGNLIIAGTFYGKLPFDNNMEVGEGRASDVFVASVKIANGEVNSAWISGADNIARVSAYDVAGSLAMATNGTFYVIDGEKGLKISEMTVAYADFSNYGEYQATISINGTKTIINYWDRENPNGEITPEKDIIISADNKSIIYGDDIPNLTYSVDGTIKGGNPELYCEATSKSPVGTYPIIVKRGNVTNDNGTYISGTLTITKAPLTISAGNYTKRQGEENPTFKASYEGFKNGETENVLSVKPQFSTVVRTSTAPGDYIVNVWGAEAQNYTINYVTGKLTVIPEGTIIITADDKTITYGDAIPQLTYKVSGATLNGTPEITCEATSESPVGTYPIIIKRGSVTNYNDTYVSGTLTIVKAPLTISAGNYSKRQGEVNPTFKATYKGFKNGETESVLTIKPKISTTVNMSTVPGKYDVLVSGAEAQNYDISYVQGTLTVTSVAAVIVTADDKTITYGENIPDLTYSVNGAALNGTPEIYCEATSTSPVGTYPIVVKRGSVTNPNDTYINGTLTIEKASQTLTWEQDFSDISQYDQVELLAVASSGLEVTYAIEGDPICEIVKIGDKQYIDCKSDGMTIIVAMQEGSNNYWATTKMYKPVLIKSATGINALEKGVDGDVRIFDASGHRLRKLQKGVNILRLSDGTTRKVFLK